MEPSVLLVHYHDIFRHAFLTFLQHNRYVVVGESQSGDDTNELYRKLQPDLCMVQAKSHLKYNGLDIIGRLLKEFPQARVIALAQNYHQYCYDALKALEGPSYLVTSISPTVMLEIIRLVHSGHPFLCTKETVEKNKEL